MATDQLHDRGGSPEIRGTRITVYNLLPYFLDATTTENDICRLYGLTLEQVAAARAYVLNNADTVLSAHLRIEERLSAGNPPEVIEEAKRTHAKFLNFKKWLEDREKTAAGERADEPVPHDDLNSRGKIPTFREWLSAQGSPPSSGT